MKFRIPNTFFLKGILPPVEDLICEFKAHWQGYIRLIFNHKLMSLYWKWIFVDVNEERGWKYTRMGCHILKKFVCQSVI